MMPLVVATVAQAFIGLDIYAKLAVVISRQSAISH